MAVYAIGDLQGCAAPLERLLDEIRFDPAADRVWLVGDLVNRGPESLRTLRLVKALGAAAVSVLGNHDLHLIARAAGVQAAKSRETLGEVLAASDLPELVGWLRQRPMLHVEGGFVLVHAGLLPEWTVAKARTLAGEVEDTLRGEGYRALLAGMYGDQPDRWEDGLEGIARLRVVINAMTRLRVVDERGAMALAFKGEPGESSEGWTPWFDVPGRKSRDHVVVCGHWSALGLLVRPDLAALDTGCVWGRRLTAMRLEDRRLFSVACPPPATPAA